MTCLRVKEFFLLFFLAAPGCLAQTWSLPLFTSDPHSVLAAANRYQAAEGTPALILDYSVSAQIDETGRLQTVTRVVTKVLRVQGIDPVQSLSLPWSLARENRPVVKTRVITTDGQAYPLDENNVVEKDPPNPNAVGAIKVLAIVLPEVNVDSVVEIEIKQGDREPALPGGRLGTITLSPGLPVAHFRAFIQSLSPADLHVETRSFPGAKVTTQAASKGHAVSVEASNFRPQFAGILLPPEVAPVPTVVFTNVPSWQSVAQWYSTLVAKATSPPLVAHAPFTGDELSAIEKIYEDLRKHVQDSGLDLAAGSIAPRPAANILKSGTANSEEEAVLLVNDLAQAGISAKLALVSAAPHPDVAPAEPGFEAFTHAFVYVAGPTPLWIDPAAEYTSVAHLPVADQDRSALIIDPATTQLVHTPASTEKDNRETAETEVRLGDGNPAKVSETIEAFGSFQDALDPVINQIASADEEEKQRIAGPIFRGAGGEQLDSTKSSDAHRLLEKSWLQIAGEGYATSLVSDDGGYIDISGIARLNFHKLAPLLLVNAENAGRPFSPGRTLDFYIAPPFTTEETYHVIPPLGYRLKEVAPVPAVTVGPMSIATTSRLDKDGSLWLTYTLTQPKSRLTPHEVDQMRSDVHKIASKNSLRLELENVAAATMKSGDIQDGLQLLRQDAAAAKDNVNPSLRLASGYVLVGARPAAVKLCDDLLKRNAPPADDSASGQPSPDTNLAAIHSRLGWIYEHDEFGRFLVAGMNYAEAEKNLQTATELAPGDATAWLQLADLYAYNLAGVHYGRSARLNDAVQIFDRLDLNAIVRAGKLNEYALVLLRARKYGELQQFFLYPQADAADQSIKWAAFAASRPESDLKDELEFRYSSPNDRRAVLILAGRQLISNREYQAASRVLHLAGKGAGITQPELDRLDRVRVFDESTLSKQPAIAVFQRYVQSLLDPETPDDWKKLVTVRNQSSTLAAQRNSLLQLFAGLGAAAADPDVWPYLSDLINTTLDFTVEGNDTVGFRLKISSLSVKASSVVVAYVVKQGNDYAVAGLANSDAPSVQATAFARAGNMPAAHQWLDWGREAAGLPKVPDAELQDTLDSVSAQLFWSEGKFEDAATILLRLHQKNPSDRAITFLLADSLIQGNRLSDAQPYIDSLEQSDPGGVPPLRLRQHLLAQQGNYAQAAAIAKQICAKPNASAADWNDFAWTTLFTQQNAGEAKAAAEKAAQATNFSSSAILHTLAIAQASALDLKDALSTGHKFAGLSGDLSEMYTIFGKIAEEVALPDTAIQYYSLVPKQESAGLSPYMFAQLRLASLQSKSASPNPARKADNF